MSRIGILAGGGRLPLLIADGVLQRGGSVHIVGIEGEAGPEIAGYPHTWVNWGQVGRMTSLLRSKADAMVIAGSVRRPDLWKLRPDWGFFLSLPQILAMMAGGDDSVLSRVVRFFEAKGIEVRGAHEVAADLLVREGPAGALALDEPSRADAELGFAVRAALGPLDAGQAVVVADGRVLAIEGAEGTDAVLIRVAALRAAQPPSQPAGRSGGLAKGPKPGQELRVDMPAIGPRTIENAAAAGLAGVALEAGSALMLDRSEAVRAADSLGIAVEGLAGRLHRSIDGTTSPAASATEAPPAIRVVGAVRPDQRALADMEKGVAAVTLLAPFETGHAVVVARAYMLAFTASEPVVTMLERVRALRQWGVGARRRIGVLVSRTGTAEARSGGGLEQLIKTAAAAGLAGIVFTGPAGDLPAIEQAGALADRHGLFLVVREAQP